MPHRRTPPALGTLAYLLAVLGLAVYFTFAAVQGESGLFRRAEIEAGEQALRAELARLQREADRMENLTRRLSDSYLDLDLLDQQARDLLGMLRADEIVIR
ncbi:MAG: septum formation initiator family protein [Roseovarius sp.]